MEKVIQEFRVIETEDGFRIEIKGDKEQLRPFVMNFDPRRWSHHQEQRGEPHHEHHHHQHRGWQHGAPWGRQWQQGGQGRWGWGQWFGFDPQQQQEEQNPPRKSKRDSGEVV